MTPNTNVKDTPFLDVMLERRLELVCTVSNGAIHFQ